MLKIADPNSGAIPEVHRALDTGLISANDGLNALEESPEVQREAMEMIFNGRTGKFARAVSMIGNDAAQAEFLASEEVLKAAASGGIVLHHSTVAGLKDLVEAGTVDAIVTSRRPGRGITAGLRTSVSFLSIPSRTPGQSSSWQAPKTCRRSWSI